MKKTMDLLVAACDHKVYEGKAFSCVLPLVDGELGVLPGHEETIYAVDIGQLRYTDDKGEVTEIFVGGGMAVVEGDSVRVLVMSAERYDEIDYNRAMEAKERAEEELRQKRSIEEYIHSQISLHRALARMKAASRGVDISHL